MSEIIIPKFREISVRSEDIRSMMLDGASVFAGNKAASAPSSRVRVSNRQGRVYISDLRPGHQGELIVGLPWEQAKELARLIKLKAQSSRTGLVQVIEDGVLRVEVPATAALKLSAAIRKMACRAEQEKKVNQVKMDQAVLIRKGIPLALTADPAVFKEAGIEAAHNRDLRRALPGGIPSGVQFGRPALIARPPRPKSVLRAEGIKSSEVFGKF